MNHFNNYLHRIVFIGLFLFVGICRAGSYEDFFRAINTDDVRTVQSLLQRGFDPNTVNPEGVPGLMLAIRGSSFKVAEVLVGAAKTKVEYRSAQDESPLMLAALRGQLNLVTQLVAKDADVNKTGWTPLHYAATGGHLAIVRLLLDEHAYIDAASPNGSTPLMMAAMFGNPETVKLLLDSGADATLVNQSNVTALDFARRAEGTESQALIASHLNRLTPK